MTKTIERNSIGYLSKCLMIPTAIVAVLLLMFYGGWSSYEGALPPPTELECGQETNIGETNLINLINNWAKLSPTAIVGSKLQLKTKEKETN